MFPTSSVSAAIQYSRHTFQVYFIANIHSEIRYKHSETRLFCSKPDCRNVLLNSLSCLVRLERHLHCIFKFKLKTISQSNLTTSEHINVIINFKDLSLLTLQLLNTDVKTFLSFQSGNVHPGTNLSMEFFGKR